jgi:ATP-dependent exoDNAse (exonuclease V) beta subunit
MGYEFNETPINFKKDLVNFGEAGERLYNNHISQLELDNLNLLYVTLTRAIEQLYIFAESPTEIKDDAPTSYNQLFGGILKHLGKWKQDKNIYEFGEPGRTKESSTVLNTETIAPFYTATSPSDRQLKIVSSESLLWETEAQTAIFEGNVLHDMMSKVTSEADIPDLFETLAESSVLSSEEIDQLRIKVNSIVEHPQLRCYYEPSVKVENEREIITASGMLLRPDRLNFNEDNSVTIIDYKTGTPSYQHEDQISSYATAIKEMGKIVSEKLLVYINQEEIVINKV